MAKKINIVETYYSILTRGPLSGRPTYFIELSSHGKKMSLKKLTKRIEKECASHMVSLSGDEVFNEEIITWCLDNNFITIVHIDNIPPSPATRFIKTLLHDKTLFLYVYVKSNWIDPNVADNAFSFNYEIDEHTILDTDGLPKDLYRPDDMRRITITPATTNATERVIEIGKHYGYYLDIPYKNFIGIR